MSYCLLQSTCCTLHPQYLSYFSYNCKFVSFDHLPLIYPPHPVDNLINISTVNMVMNFIGCFLKMPSVQTCNMNSLKIIVICMYYIQVHMLSAVTCIAIRYSDLIQDQIFKYLRSQMSILVVNHSEESTCGTF